MDGVSGAQATASGHGTSVLMISMPLISGFSTWWLKVMSTEPSLVTLNVFIVAFWVPGLADRSMLVATDVPSIVTPNLR